MSTNKIIALVVFFSAAMMTSLFLSHMKQTPSTPLLTPEEGIVFPLARDIKEFNLLASDNKPFTQDNLRNHWTILFFGFTHCGSVCPTTLAILNQVYNKLQPTYPTLQVALISVDPERDSPATLQQYVRSFNPAFIGVTGKVDLLRKMQAQFGITSLRDEATPSSNYQITHTSSIMLINPNGQWAAMLRYGQPADQLIAAITKTIKG